MTAPGIEITAAERRYRWAEVGIRLAAALLSGTGPEESLRLLAGAVRELTGADVAVVLAPRRDDPGSLVLTVADGPAVDDIEGVRFPLPGTTLGDIYADGGSRVVEDVAVLPIVGRRGGAVVELTEGYGPAVFVPLGELPGRSLLAVLRVAGSAPFDIEDAGCLSACAGRCAELLDLAGRQELSRRDQLHSDRERIARDLHDHVVQRIFAIGLALDRISRSLESGHPELAARVSRTVDDLDATVTDIRTAIFELQRSDVLPVPTPSERLTDVVHQVTGDQGLHCSIRIQGPVDDLPRELWSEVAAVVRELVTNVVRHARATRATVLVRAGTSTLDVVVVDDGIGLPDVGVRSGLANVATRAERLRGRLTTTPAAPGTEVRWTVPLPPE